METHVSSTAAGVPETQEVIGTHGDVEMVIVVEKVEEDQQQKADSNSQANAQPVMEGNSSVSRQTTNKDGLHTSPSKQDQVQKSVDKDINQSKAAQPSSKTLCTKPSEQQISQNKLSDKQVGNVTPNAANKEPRTTFTSQNDDTIDGSEEMDNKDITLNITLERDISIDPQTEMSSDASEKDHNKSISRELKSLINSAKESKIISECTKLTTKTRKSRAALDTSSTSATNTPESESIENKRRSSSNSQKSNTSEKSDKVGKRSMRSQNPEFVHKVKKFLNSVTGKFQKGGDSDASSDDEEMVAIKNKQNTSESISSTSNRNLNAELVQSQTDDKNNKLRSDPYCWRCHWSNDMMDGEKTPQPPLKCTVCPRVFHYRCLTGTERTKIVSEKSWVCPECMTVLHAESSESRSSAMKNTSLGMLCELLKYALQRMTEVNGAEPFLQPVDRTVFPDYDKFVVHPMDLSLMKENISEGIYGSTEAFLADSHWILHNSIIFNTLQSKLTTVARALVRSCRAEMGEIEACPECYAAAHARRATWFTDVCTMPHLLLWAKLKGFPYWPAKAMSVSLAGLVDVRFFGAHDRAWVPARDCYLYSEKDPNNFRTKRQDILDSMLEAQQHIRNISRKFGKFVYAPYRVVFEPFRLEEHLKLMIPSFDGPVKSPIRDRRPKTPAPGKKSRSNSKSSKDDSNVGEILSDSEPIDVESTKNSEDGDKTERATSAGRTQTISTRKRQRSEAKEGLAAGPDGSPKEKRRLVDGDGKEPAAKKPDAPAASSSKETVQKPKEPNNGAADEPIEIDSEPASPNPTQPTPHISDAPATRLTPSKLVVVAARGNSVKPDAPATRSTPNKSDHPGARPVQNKLDTPATRSTPNKADAAAKTNKNTTTKTNDAGLTPTKTPAKTDIAKVNDKGKSVPQEENTTPQNQRNSRNTKSVANVETIEVDEINASSSPGKSTKQPVSSTSKINANTNKTSPKESVSLVKTVEKEKGSDSAVLIKINEQGNSINPNKMNSKEKLVESATITKITNAGKVTPNKNKGKEKESDCTTTNKDAAKEKVTISPTPAKTAGKVNSAPTSTVNKQSGNDKTKEPAAKSNETGVTVKPTQVSSSSNNPGQEKAKETSSDKTTRTDKTLENSTDGKNDNVEKEKSTPAKSGLSNSPKPSTSKVGMATKDRIQFDDDISLAVVTRKGPKTNDAPATVTSGSLRNVVPATPPATRSSVTAKTKTTQITVEVNPDSNIFTPTSTDNVRNMKDAVNKLQKLRSGLEPPANPQPNPQVGRVGVRAFARMTSPPEPSNDLLVEIKSEPMEFEEGDTQLEPSVLDSLRPRPVPPVVAGGNLREVRISKVMPAAAVLKKGVKPDVRPRAKKTFPQPKKPDDGRAELTNKNSMVYIPIQPPISQAPVRAALKASMHSVGPSTSMPARPPTIFSTTNVKALMGPPLVPMGPPPPPPLPPLATTSATATVASSPAPAMSPMGGAGPAIAGAIIAASAFPTVPTTVHTVPLITSVNGQWTLSLQPVMSVGGSGNNMSSHTVNGVSDRLVTAVAASSMSALPPPALSASALPPPPAPIAPLNRVQPEVAPGEPPRLQQRPALQHPLAASTEIGEMTAPSTAGPLTAKLNQNSLKLAEFFRTLLEDSLVQVEEPAAEAAALRLQLEQARWQHQQEVAELRHTHELMLVEVRSAMEKEKTRAVAEARRLAHQELEAAVKNAKSKQWCSNCGQEAQFYCCWNTSYCDYPCQRAHWAQHFSACTQQRTTGVNSTATEQAQSMPPPDVPKTTSALIPTGKVTSAASRLVGSEQAKSPVVGNVGAMEDASGHGGAKSVGASPAAAVLASPIHSNKQLMNIEECGTKRVVTSSSGGFLIVGAGAAVVAPARRD